jgi:preprotein translocase subunit SecG
MPGWMKWTIALLIGGAIIVAGWRLTDSHWFFWLLPAFFVVNCLVLIIVVLLQSGKAADLAGAFGGAGSQTAFGPRGAANVLSKATTWCAIMFMLCAMALVLRTDKAVEQGGGGSVLQNISKPAPKKAAPTPPAPGTPAAPQPVAPSTPPGAPAAPQPVAPTSTKQPDAQQPATQQPAQQPPATSQPASAPPKKP